MVGRRAILAGGAVATAAPLAVGDYVLFLLSTVCVLGIYAASYDLVFGVTGMLSLGHAVFFGTGAYVVAHTVPAEGPGFLWSLGLAAVAATLLAVPLGALAVRVSSHAFVLVTLLFVLVAELVARSWPSVTGGTDGFVVIAPTVTLPVLGEVALYDPAVRYGLVLASLVATLLALRWLVATRLGLGFRLARENPRRAAALGYPVRRLRHAAFAVGAGGAGLAGGLSALATEQVTASEFSIMTTADPVVFTLLGGRGTLVGGVLGSGVVRGIRDGVSGATAAYPLVLGAVLIGVVVLAPDGLIGAARRLGDLWRERR